jgi:S-methylmethionine-dependent homocysteine/selenocysteine methylase
MGTSHEALGSRLSICRSACVEPAARPLSNGGLVLMDGPAQAELSGPATPGGQGPRADRWLAAEDLVTIHRSYVDAGCDVIRTPTSALPRAFQGADAPGAPGDVRPLRWVDQARERIEAARAASAGTSARVAFTLGPQIDGPDGDEIVRVLTRLFQQVPPDLILIEALTVVRPSLYRALEEVRSLDLPLWLSFRRCSEGLCGPGGHHWAGDGPDSFGHAAARLEKLGVSALLVNCIPRDHVEATIDYLRYFTDLPLGAYPDLDAGLGSRMPGADGAPADYVELARRWERAGAQVVGVCCGGDPGLLAELRRQLTSQAPAVVRQRPAATARTPSAPPWTSARGRRLFPLPLPRIASQEGVASPAAGDLLLWEYLYREGGGANQRCLQVGSGSGLLAVQLALNGATHVHAIDIDPRAVRSTLESAFLNDVSSSLTAEGADLNSWLPGERYELVVASVEQPAIDPTSLISQRRTMEMLSAAGMEAQVVDWHFWPAGVRQEARPHLDQIEQVSDAFHFRVADQEEILVVYLLEIRRLRSSPPGLSTQAAVLPDADGRSLTWA